MEDSGLFSDKNIILYEREDFTKETSFVTTEVIGSSKWGWIVGPPGCGKSITLYVFLLQSKEWKNFTWIHLSRRSYPKYVQFSGNYKCCGKLDDASHLRELLELHSNEKHIVVLDGFTDATDEKPYLLECQDWRSQNFELRRMIVVCSMSSRGKYNVQDDFNEGIKQHFVNSWKIEEYYKAITEDMFYASVKEYLDSSLDSSSILDRKELIESKYYFGGGSSRLMFCFKTKAVENALDDSVLAVNDVAPYIQGTIGGSSDSVVNRLFNVYKDTTGFSVSIVQATLTSNG